MHAEREQTGAERRLLRAVVDLAGKHGYEHVTVARLIARAGVSRATFYKHFTDREDCFLRALSEIEGSVLAQVGERIARRPPQLAAAAAIGALLAFAEAEPPAARFLMNETLAGGPRILDARDEALRNAARLIEDAYGELPAGAPIPDLPATLLLGATHRLLGSRLRRGERGLLVLGDDLLGWLAAHAHPAADHRWRSIEPLAQVARSPFVPEAPLRAPPALSPSRPRPSASALAENHRLRIIFATAQAIQAHGYLGGSVAEITRLAGLDARAFYRLFNDKQDAFMAVHELGFQRTMAATAGAFFAAEDWPRRIWEGARAFTQCLGQNPTLSHVSLIDSHAGGPDTVQRFEDLTAGFTIFLQEGYQYEGSLNGRGPTALALEAAAAANFEALYGQARSRAPAMAGLPAQLSYVAFTPFVGPVIAGQLIDELIAGERPAQLGEGGERPR